MGTSLNGLLPQNTYSGLIKVGNNTALNTTLKQLSDGAGNDLPMQASTTGVNFTGTVAGVVSGVSGAIQFSNGSAFASDAANLFWDDTNNRLGVGTNTPSVQLEVQNNARIRGGLNLNGSLSNSSTGIVDINSLTYVNGVSGFVGVGISTPSARLHVRGSGSTSATTSLLVQNSAGTAALTIKDDLSATFGGTATASSFTGTDYFSLISELRLAIGTAPNRTLLKPIGDGILCILNAAETDFNRLQFGGTTSSFPSIKRNGTAIDLRLADDSNYALLNTGATFIKGSGSTATTNALLVQNGGGTNLFRVRDDGNILCEGGGAISSVGIIGTVYGLFGSQSYDPSVVLGAQSTSAGFLPPRMTTTQKNAIATPATGLVLYDTTTNKLQCWNGTTWNDLF